MTQGTHAEDTYAHDSGKVVIKPQMAIQGHDEHPEL